jgi:hypothetical protein
VSADFALYGEWVHQFIRDVSSGHDWIVFYLSLLIRATGRQATPWRLHGIHNDAAMQPDVLFKGAVDYWRPFAYPAPSLTVLKHSKHRSDFR